MAAFIHQRTVEFHETDAAGLVHFTNYFRFAESAEHAMFREIDYSMMLHQDGAFYGWPRVRAQIKYSAPLYSGDQIEVQLGILEIKDKAIEYSFRVVRLEDGSLAAKGTFSTLHVSFDDGASREMKTRKIPETLRSKLQPYLLP
jgi:acyl-CoA thioester hydrolase